MDAGGGLVLSSIALVGFLIVAWSRGQKGGDPTSNWRDLLIGSALIIALSLVLVFSFRVLNAGPCELPDCIQESP